MFRDLKVLELASVLAGPSVGQFFAELGADVIKVENARTGGDVTRSWKGRNENTDDLSAYFCSVNWGKKSIDVDLTSQEGRDIIYKLIRQTDIVIASYKPGDAEKLGVDYRTLSSLNPKIIYGQVTGYGLDDQKVGYDAVIQAEAGFMFMNGEPGGSHLKMPVALIDILAAHQLKEALLLALIYKSKSGRGSFTDVSLLQCGISALVNQANNWLMSGVVPQKQGSSHPNIAPYGDTFKTLDDSSLLVAVGNDKQFQDLCELLNIPEVGIDLRYQTNASRVAHREALNSTLQAAFNKRKSGEIMAELERRKVPAGLVRPLDQVFDLPKAREIVFEQQGIYGLRTFVANLHFVQRHKLSSPPHVGEHTSIVLGGL